MNPTFDLVALQTELTRLLVEFDRVCRKHGIKYSIDGGTLLGKARHNGFIPWDDDIDVVMLRSEYEKLKQIAADEFKAPYFLQNEEADPLAMRGHPQLRNSSKTMIQKSEFKDGKAIYRFNQGLFIDIFVLDSIPDDESERAAWFKELSCLKMMMQRAKVWSVEPLSFGLTPAKLKRFFAGLKNKLWLARVRRTTGQDPRIYLQTQFAQLCRRYESVPTREVSHVGFQPQPPSSRIFLRAQVQDIEDTDFLGNQVMMLKNWEYYLEHLYGNWHEPVKGAANHDDLIVDLSRPYTNYF